MSERKLCTVQKIATIAPIAGADNIVLATMENLGWQCVVKKDEFQIGDKVLYCEIDSVLPDKPEFEFLKSRKFRIRTIKLKNTLSQGLILPIESMLGSPNMYNIGDDVTEDMEITKYLSPSEREEIEQQERKIANEKSKLKKFMMRYSWFRRLFLSRKQKNGFPYWASKTDEIRGQSLHWNEFYEQFKDEEVYITEKIDGCSGTFTGKMLPKFNNAIGRWLPFKKFQFIVCSRNLTVTDKNTIYWKVAQKYNLEQILKANPNLIIQGECSDTKIQGNKYGFKETTFHVFNIIDYVKNYQYDWGEMERFCLYYGLNTVPLLSLYTGGDEEEYFPRLKDIGETVQDFIEFAKGKSVIANIQREGVVIRCIKNGRKVFSFKSINNDFLLKYDE